MSDWDTINKWVVTDVETDESILTYKGSFIDVMDFLNVYYEDGIVDVETYENWLNRQ
jgi:hypothetical protein